MQRVQRLLRSVDRVQQRSRWLGFPLAVMRKFRDDHGGALTTVIAYNAFFALFPLLLVVVTVLGFLLGRDSGFQQRLVGSAVAEFPIIGEQVRAGEPIDTIAELYDLPRQTVEAALRYELVRNGAAA